MDAVRLEPRAVAGLGVARQAGIAPARVDDARVVVYYRYILIFKKLQGLFVEFLRGGSVILGVRILDVDEMGDELSAAGSSKFLANRVATSALQIGSTVLTEIVRSPSPPPPPPQPSLPTLNSSLALSGDGDEVPDPCAASDAATFFNVSLECTPQFNVGTLRLTVLVCVGGGVLVAALLAILWFVGFDDEDRRWKTLSTRGSARESVGPQMRQSRPQRRRARS